MLKKTALESFYKWYTDKTSNIPYSESLLFKALNSNSDSFLTTLDTTLKDNIVEYNWKDDIIKIDEEKLQLIDNAIAETDSENESELKRLYDEYEKIYLDAFKKEKEDVQNKVNAKIGLISITDFCNSFSSFDKCFRSFIGLKVGDTSMLQTNWMSLSSNDQKVGYEWTNNYYGYFSLNGLHIAWYVSNVSCIYTGDMPMNGYLRPVFYLSNNVRIIDGNGSLENPFKLNI